MDKTIYITVDTECHNFDKINEYITGKTSKDIFGLEKILQIGKEMNVPINVFLDIPECHVYGDEYIQSIVDIINKYGQPILLHVHPDYIADPARKHLWEYTKEEQKSILRQAIHDYNRFCGNSNKLVFRAGAWGVNSETYEVLSELCSEYDESEIIDLSYVYKRERRCHLTRDEYGAINASKKYKNVTILPNTTYIGYDFFGKQYALEVSVTNPNYRELKQIIDTNTLQNITYTMHSWDFLKKWFFLPGYIAGNRHQIKVFKRIVSYARKKGYIFGKLTDFQLTSDNDQCINICKGISGKLKCLWYRYIQFLNNGRSYKKYAILYFSPAIILLLIMLVILILLL